MAAGGLEFEFDFSCSSVALVHPLDPNNGNNSNTNTRRRMEISSHKAVHSELVSKFLKYANEDIVLEILLRLGNCRSAIRLSSVCKHWHALVSDPQFVPRFIGLHPHYDHSACTFLFHTYRTGSRYGYGYDYGCKSKLVCRLFSKESLFLHGKHARSSSYFDFIPYDNTHIVIKASFNDLLLMSCVGRYNYFICNPVTKRWFEVPSLPYHSGKVGASFICSNDLHVSNNNNARYGFKVVQIYRKLENGNYQIRVVVQNFCSESREWSQQCFSCLQPTMGHYADKVVACNEILYWMDGSDRVLALDLFNSHCGAIHFPNGLLNDVGFVANAHLGAVRGELRLLHIGRTRPGTRNCFVIKVWELNRVNNSWVSVHERNLSDPNVGKKLASVAFHPRNCDVVFMVWGMRVFEYRISRGFFHKLGELQESIGEADLQCFTLVHPAWPTPVPSQSI